MNTKSILCSLVIASLGMSSVAFAQQRYDNRGNGRGQDARENRQEDRRDARDNRQDARQDQREARQERRYYNARSTEFHRGGRLPPELRDRGYVVNDWRSHRLSAPPRGYNWVQVGPDYVLAAVATGIIANLILNR